MYRIQDFSSFEEFNAFSHGWDAHFRVAQTGNFNAQIEQLVGQQILVNVASMDTGTIQRGSTPVGMRTFALPITLGGPATWLNQEIDPHALMLFPKTGELFCIAGGPMRMATLSVKEELFENVGNTLLSNKLCETDAEQMSELQSTRWHQLQQKLQLLITFKARYGHLSESHEWLDYMEEELVNSFVSSLPTAAHSMGTITPSAAARNTHRAVDYIMDNLRKPFAISSMCDDLQCSRRTLESSFKRCTGTSLLPFIKFQRFTHCRAELLSANDGTDTVTSIARSWGFWHPGQFSTGYKALFGESPSNTLASGAQAVPTS